MSEHHRAFVVILVLSLTMFALVRKPAVALGMEEADFARRRNLWLAATAAAFLAYNFWIFVLVIGALLLFSARKDSNPLALYLFLLFAVPPFAAALPGLGVVNQLFELSFPRMLSLIVLLPFTLRRREPGALRFGKSIADWLVVAYLLLQLLLQWRADSLTNTLRSGFYAYLDAFLPYYVASRSFRSSHDIRDALAALVVSALLLVPIAAFEFVKHWLLYAALPAALDMHWDGSNYLGRGDTLRATATAGHSIAFGYLMMIALLLHFGLRHAAATSRVWVVALVLLATGLVVSVSRGPWVGAAVGLVVLTAAGRRPARSLGRLFAIAAVSAAVLAVTPWGASAIDYLPFVGSIDEANVSYRQQLFDLSLLVISQSPWFGSPYFMFAAPLQELRNGNLIDIVNIYLLVALRTGYVGLALFCGIFASAIGSTIAALRAVRGDGDPERHEQGQAILGVLAGVLVTIATVSDVSFIPILYWCAAGLAIGYHRLVVGETRASPRRRAAFAMGSI